MRGRGEGRGAPAGAPLKKEFALHARGETCAWRRMGSVLEASESFALLVWGRSCVDGCVYEACLDLRWRSFGESE